MYEDEITLAAQSNAVPVIEKAFHCEIHWLRKYYEIDFAAARQGKVVAWIEYKRRNNNHDQYGDYFVAFSKICSLNTHAINSGIPAFLVVQWNDGFFYHKIQEPNTYELKLGGWKNQRDPTDFEPVMHIPLEQFRKMEQ